jgi:hypothetical protein
VQHLAQTVTNQFSSIHGIDDMKISKQVLSAVRRLSND